MSMTSTVRSVLLIDQATVSLVAELDELIVAVELAFAAHATGQSLEPKLAHVEADGGEFHIKTGGLRSPGRTYFACKVGAGFFQNRIRFGLPNIVGLIMLNDGTTGVPLAVMDSSTVTRLRTGAATAVAAKYLARPDSRTALICGAGVQAAIQLRSLTRTLPLARAHVWSRHDSRAFVQKMSSELDIEVLPSDDLLSAALDSDVIVTCTPARCWFLGRSHVKPGTFIAAVGADSPGKQELEPELVSQCSVVCDIFEQCIHVGELQYSRPADAAGYTNVRGQLGEVITGKIAGRQNPEEIILFDSTGTALQDVAAAALVYERCLARGLGRNFSFLTQ